MRTHNKENRKMYNKINGEANKIDEM